MEGKGQAEAGRQGAVQRICRAWCGQMTLGCVHVCMCMCVCLGGGGNKTKSN